MGEVHEALQLTTGRRVALKLLRAKVADEDTNARLVRFEREVRATAALSSPYIVEIFDAGRDDATGEPFMAMELLDGIDVASLAAGRRVPVHVALRIVAQACLGLTPAHDAGIVHRDIKPANLFLTRPGADGLRRVKVLDFGVARFQPLAGADAQAMELTDLTESGMIVGSPRYMAPEQIRASRAVDARADVWSLGVVLYRLIAGVTPHERIGASIGDVLVSICSEPAPPLSAHVRDVPAHVEALVARALAISPDDRFANVRELTTALRASVPEGSLTITDAAIHSMPERDSTVRLLDARARVHGRPDPHATTALPRPPARRPIVRRQFLAAAAATVTLASAGAFAMPIVLAPKNDVPSLPDTHPSAPEPLPPQLATTDGAAWFEKVRGRCNPIEAELVTRESPPPVSKSGVSFQAACFALANKLGRTRALLDTLPSNDRAWGAWAVFEVVHPVADAGDDTAAGPAMRLVLEYWPSNYMALYHAGMAEYATQEPAQARAHLTKFLELYSRPDGFTASAKRVLAALDEPANDDCSQPLAVDPEGRSYYRTHCHK